MRRGASPGSVDLRIRRTRHVAAERLAELEYTSPGLILELSHSRLELGWQEVTVDVVPTSADVDAIVARLTCASECHAVNTGPHFGPVGARLAS